MVGFGRWQFNTMVKKELRTYNIVMDPEENILTHEMIDTLPPIVQKWLHRANVIDREMIQTVYLKQTGNMRTSPGSRWIPFTAEQWFKTYAPGFIWTADVKAAPGIYLQGRDKYENGEGHMLIKLLSLFAIADESGVETDQGSMLRYLAEIIWFPSVAVSDYIRWEQAGPGTAKAIMTCGDITASGLFKFNAEGDIISFEAMRYYTVGNGATLEKWIIQTDPGGYREFNGVRIPASGTVTWRLEDGDYTWLKLEIKEICYNGM